MHKQWTMNFSMQMVIIDPSMITIFLFFNIFP